MANRSPAHITVALPPGVRPSDEMSEVLIRKFLKACKKENLQVNVLDKSAEVRHYETPLRLDKIKRKADKKRAIAKYKAENDPASNDKAPKKRRDSRE
jgi:ribosomal protein S21